MRVMSAPDQVSSRRAAVLAVKGITGGTADEFARLYEQAKRLGRSTSFTAAEVAARQLNLGRPAFSPAGVDGGREGAAEAGVAAADELP